MHVVVGDGGPVDDPELRAACAPAAGLPDVPVVGVVAGDLVVVHGDAGASALEAVFAVVLQAGIGQDIAGAEHDPGPGAVLDRDVVDAPAGTLVVVDHALAAVVPGGTEVLDGQVPYRDVLCRLGERVEVAVLAIQDSAGGADEGVAVLGDDLAELAGAERMPAGREPVGRVRTQVPGVREDGGAVVARRDYDRSLGRGCGAAVQDRLVPAHPYRRRGGARGRWGRTGRQGKPQREPGRAAQDQHRGRQDGPQPHAQPHWLAVPDASADAVAPGTQDSVTAGSCPPWGAPAATRPRSGRAGTSRRR